MQYWRMEIQYIQRFLLIISQIYTGVLSEVLITRTPVATVDKDGLFVECRPADSGINFQDVNSIQIYRNSSAILGTESSKVVSIVYSRNDGRGIINWQDLSVESRANATGSVDNPSVSFLRIEIGPNHIQCIDGAVYKCEISGTDTMGGVNLASGETSIEIQSIPSKVDPITSVASDGSLQINSTFGRYEASVSLELTCNMTVGKPPKNIVWCIRNYWNDEFLLYTENITTSNAEEFGNCQNKRMSILQYTLSDEDDFVTFLCQDDSNASCNAGLIQASFTATTHYEETTDISTDITTLDFTTEPELSETSTFTDSSTDMFNTQTNTPHSDTQSMTYLSTDVSSAALSTETEMSESMTSLYITSSVDVPIDLTTKSETSDPTTITMTTNEFSTTMTSLGELTSQITTLQYVTSNTLATSASDTPETFTVTSHGLTTNNEFSTSYNTVSGFETSNNDNIHSTSTSADMETFPATDEVTTIFTLTSSGAKTSSTTTTTASTTSLESTGKSTQSQHTESTLPEHTTTTSNTAAANHTVLTTQVTEASTHVAMNTNSTQNIENITSSTSFSLSTFYQSGKPSTTSFTTGTGPSTTRSTPLVTSEEAHPSDSLSSTSYANNTASHHPPMTISTTQSTTARTTRSPSTLSSTTAAPQRYSHGSTIGGFQQSALVIVFLAVSLFL